ncbi:hypothetical protein [Virgibacillus necropolis]|uniref:hypothetical protein n=1 Tax=Virgibacillus necropolis TaxID=163877 RepID=UPI0013748146|nr:hypothetical protein [Virgibacillus necropolis]
MKKIANGITKFFVANLAVVLAILLLPVFLITDDVALFEQIMSYLFNDNKG